MSRATAPSNPKEPVKVPSGCLVGEVFQACPAGRRPRADPGLARVISSVGWLGNISPFPKRGGRGGQGEGKMKI